MLHCYATPHFVFAYSSAASAEELIGAVYDTVYGIGNSARGAVEKIISASAVIAARIVVIAARAAIVTYGAAGI